MVAEREVAGSQRAGLIEERKGIGPGWKWHIK